MPGVEVLFDPETEPRTDFGKLEEGGVYPARVYDFEEGLWATSGKEYVGFLIEINDSGDHWRKLPRNAYQCQTIGNVGNLRSLLHATGVLPVAKQKEMGKAYVNYTDLVGLLFQVKITYMSMGKPPLVSEYPRVRSVFPMQEHKETDNPLPNDLPF